ncbi:hypothetical protein ACU4GD_11455 [Cupriavidus basilensis]
MRCSGHELAHYLLGHATTASSWWPTASSTTRWPRPAPAAAIAAETYRRYALHTELFADRGGAAAAGAVAPAVSTLVKVQTGIGSSRRGGLPAPGRRDRIARGGASDAHQPSGDLIRARALALGGERGAAGLDQWIETRLTAVRWRWSGLTCRGNGGSQALTRGFPAHYLAGTPLAQRGGAGTGAHALPDWRDDEPAVGPEAFAARRWPAMTCAPTSMR